MNPTLICCFSKNNGGMELNAMGIAKLLQNKTPVTMVCRKGSYIETLGKELASHGIELFTIDFKGGFSFKCIKAVKQIIEAKNIKNLIFFGASELKSLYFACANKQINFINFHGTTKTHTKKDLLHSFFYKVVTYHVAISKHIKDNVIKIIPHTSEQNVHVIGLPYDDKNFHRKAFKPPFEIINVARIAGGKGHSDCLKVLEKLLSDNIPARLTFVGGIENELLYDSLREQIRSSPLLSEQNVIFAGFTRNVSEYYSNAHIMLFPSQGEGLSNSIIESFFHRVLPITYNNTVFPEYLTRGFKFPQVPTNDINQLYQATKNILALDETSFENLVDHNYKLAQEFFSSDQILKQYSHILS